MCKKIFIVYLSYFVFSVLGLDCKEKKVKGGENKGEKVILIDLTKKGEWSRAVFAGGCFWCMEPPYDKLDGVKASISGYAGGQEANPTYKEVASGLTSHTESILILYDPKKISYAELVEVFWKNIDPTQKDGQFYDRGRQYRTAIFYLDAEQKKIAEESKKKLEKSGRFKKPIVTEVSPIKTLWQAEEYHQDYYKKNPIHYYTYRKSSGRDSFIETNWE